MVQKVLEGLTKFNSLSKALLDLRDGKDGALFRKNWCLFFHGFCVYKIESTIAVYSDVCFGFALKKNGFGSMLMWGEMPTTKTHLPSITWAPGRVLPLRGALRRGFARDLRI